MSKSPRVSHTRALDGDKRGWGAECCCRPTRTTRLASSGSELPPPILLVLTFHGWRVRVLIVSVCYLRSRVRLSRAGRVARLQCSCAFLEALRHLHELEVTRIIPRQPSGDAR